MKPESIGKALKEALDEEEENREKAYRSSRELIKACRESISAMVRGEEPDISGIGEKCSKLEARSTSRFGFVEDAMTEYAEAMILHSAIEPGEIPSPSEMGIGERAYALGVCDAIGELRRLALQTNLKGDIELSISYLDRMRDLFSMIEGLTYPSGMIPLKRKQDVARTQLDRTLGEIMLARRIYAKEEK